MNAITVRRYGMMTRCGSIGVRRVVNHQRKNPPTKRGTRATASTPTSRNSRKSHEPTNIAIKRTDVIRGEGAGSGLTILKCLRWPNDPAQQPRGLDELGVPESVPAPAICCSGWIGGIRHRVGLVAPGLVRKPIVLKITANAQ